MKIIIPLLLILLSCSPNIKYHPYMYNGGKNVELRDALLSNFNPVFGLPKELLGKEGKADSLISNYLKTGGYKVYRSDAFSNLINRNLQSSGGPYDPFSGKLQTDVIDGVLKKTAIEYCHIKNIDFVVIPFLVPRSAKLQNQYGYWDGVDQMIIVDSDFRTISNYNFTGDCIGLSLKILIINKMGDTIFKSFGGIELATKLVLEGNTLKSDSRDDHLEDEHRILKGIKIAFHPFIKDPNYPNNPTFANIKEHETNPEMKANNSEDPSVKDFKDYERSLK